MSMVSVTGETKLAAGGTRESRSETLYVWRSIPCVCVCVHATERHSYHQLEQGCSPEDSYIQVPAGGETGIPGQLLGERNI